MTNTYPRGVTRPACPRRANCHHKNHESAIGPSYMTLETHRHQQIKSSKASDVARARITHSVVAQRYSCSKWQRQVVEASLMSAIDSAPPPLKSSRHYPANSPRHPHRRWRLGYQYYRYPLPIRLGYHYIPRRSGAQAQRGRARTGAPSSFRDGIFFRVIVDNAVTRWIAHRSGLSADPYSTYAREPFASGSVVLPPVPFVVRKGGSRRYRTLPDAKHRRVHAERAIDHRDGVKQRRLPRAL